MFLTTKQKYDEVNRRNCIPNRKFKILLEDESVEDAYEALLEYRCRTCDAGPLFNSFDALKSHMSRTHTLFPCDLCVNHLKVYILMINLKALKKWEYNYRHEKNKFSNTDLQWLFEHGEGQLWVLKL